MCHPFSSFEKLSLGVSSKKLTTKLCASLSSCWMNFKYLLSCGKSNKFFREKKEKSLEKFYHIFNTLDNRKAFNLNVHETRVAGNDRVKPHNFFKQN